MKMSKMDGLTRKLTYGAAVLSVAVAGFASDSLVKPTKEELQMTSLPGYPGVAAVVLYREEIDNDDLHEALHYERIKVLTEEGKKYANVSLGFVSESDFKAGFENDESLDAISARTIHADGTVVPFTGRPYLKVMEKGTDQDVDYKVQEKIFTLPDVQIGSILEYRYTTRLDDHVYQEPTWYLQGDLYVKAAHYEWYPTSHPLIDANGATITSFSWFSNLPPGDKVEEKDVMLSARSDPQRTYSVTVKDVPPLPQEEYMLPLSTGSYRVMFAYTPYRTLEAYWKTEGKDWSKHMNSFVDPNAELKTATQAVIAGATTQDAKLQRIYATVMSLENTRYTRTHEAAEDKAEGLRKVNNAADVLRLKRGTATQLTELFVGMARAAGMKAYLMLVPDRSKEIFTQQWASFEQFDDMIAVVNVDGNEMLFDPGSRYCAYGMLAWQHTFVEGLRQTDDGSEFGRTPRDMATDNVTARVANLSMDDEGQIKGKVDLTYLGAPALQWRQRALRGDDESLKHGLVKSLEAMVPKSLDVELAEIKNLEDYDKPLMVSFTVKGTLGTSAGKRILLPVDLFLAGEEAMFPHEKRDFPVYFHYPEKTQDALRISFAKGFTVEAVPDTTRFALADTAAYDMTVTSTPNSFTTRRNYLFNEFLIPSDGYSPLRNFYSQFEGKDQESVVVKKES